MAAVTILTLGLGLAATTAVFSVVSTVLLKPLPYPDPDRLVLLVNTWRHREPDYGVSIPRFVIWRDQTTAFQDAAAYQLFGLMDLSTGVDASRVVAGRVTASFFRLFGAPIFRGRTFTDRDDRPGSAPVVVLSHGVWQRQFGADPGIVGRTVLLAGEPTLVIGVLASTFDPRGTNPAVMPPPDVWVPLRLDPTSQSDANNLIVAARLKPGVSLGEAQAQTEVATAAFREAWPGVMPPANGLGVRPLAAFIVGDVRPVLLLLTAAVASVLLIVIANTTCLLLVQASSRWREVAIRVAIGASRGRLVRQFLMESLLLALAGGALGLVLGIVGMRALLGLQPGDIPRIAPDGSDILVDWRILLFALGTSIASGAIVGLLPALRASRLDVDAVLRSSGDRGATGTARGRALLVFVEVALASMLLVGTGLLIRSFTELRRVHPGIEVHGVLTMETPVTARQYRTASRTMALVEAAAQAIRAVPGVEGVAATLTGVPLEGEKGALKISVVGAGPDRFRVGAWRVISPDYFTVLQTPLVRGRLFTNQDTATSEPVVIINQALARRLWPNGANPLDDRLRLGEGAGPEFDDQPRRIVGIVGDVHQDGLGDAPLHAAYVPIAQLPDGEMALFHRAGVALTWVVRTASPPSVVSHAIQEAVRTATGAPAARMRSMEEVATASTARPRFELWVMTIFGGIAVVLAGLGVYGVAAYAVQQRTREIGIRLALGATAGAIGRLVLVRGVGLALVGVAVGMGAAFALAQLLSRFLFGVTPHDATVFAIVPCVVAVVALAAVWLPARRATRVEPIIALRAD